MKNQQPSNDSLLKKRAIFFVLAALLFLVLSSFLNSSNAQENEFPGERIVHLLQEPRHRTVHQEGDLYLLDVQLNPGDISLPHIHDQAIMLTIINTPDGPGDGRVRSITDYADEPFTHKVENNGSELLRIIALVNGGAGNTDLEDRPEGLPIEPELEDAWETTTITSSLRKNK